MEASSTHAAKIPLHSVIGIVLAVCIAYVYIARRHNIIMEPACPMRQVLLYIKK